MAAKRSAEKGLGAKALRHALQAPLATGATCRHLARAVGPVRADKLGCCVRTPELEERNGQNDLPLGDLRDRVPERLRRLSRRHLVALRPREADVVGVHDVPNEAGHGNTAVFDLRLAKEADRRRIRVTPELAARKVERIKESNNWVELALGISP